MPARGGFENHKVVDQILHQSGVTLLHNRSELLHIQNREFTLVGVGDLWSDEIDAAFAFENVRGDAPAILSSFQLSGRDMRRLKTKHSLPG